MSENLLPRKPVVDMLKAWDEQLELLADLVEETEGEISYTYQYEYVVLKTCYDAVQQIVDSPVPMGFGTYRVNGYGMVMRDVPRTADENEQPIPF